MVQLNGNDIWMILPPHSLKHACSKLLTQVIHSITPAPKVAFGPFLWALRDVSQPAMPGVRVPIHHAGYDSSACKCANSVVVAYLEIHVQHGCI